MSAPRYAVIDSDGDGLSATQLSQIAAVGVNSIVMQVQWDQLQPNGAGTALDSGAVAAMNAYYDLIRAHGMTVIMEQCLHNPPAWVKSGVEQFKDQNGTNYTGGAGSDVRNWIWTANGRQYVADYTNKVAAALGSSRIATMDCIKFGGSIYGELQYNINGSSFMGFGNSMQTGSGLAAGLSICPHPGYKPYGGNDTFDYEWFNWYIDGMVNWMLYFAQCFKTAGYTCDLHAMLPSSGLATTDTRGSGSYTYQVSQGVDYTRQVGAMKRDPQIWPWATWINGPMSHPTNDGGNAAWARLWAAAAVRGKQSRIWGENTGGEGDTTSNGSGTGMSMFDTFQNPLGKTTPPMGMPALTGTSSAGNPGWTSYAGMMWLNSGSLFGGGADLAYFGQRIAARNALG
jgi:hypothetical protein